ncbi:hypothetical protein JTB14_001828 [Gonioctena quinquepunctata]|nr:hypothetical protein JTB14_001828 [Gonioctena quinquepunctata]
MIKTNAPDEVLIKTAVQNSLSFNKGDLVILWPNMLDYSLRTEICDKLKNTNLILITEPFKHNLHGRWNGEVYRRNLATFEKFHHKRKNCSSVSSTEQRALALQNRSLIFFCKTCREAFKNVPNLIRQFDSPKSEIANLKDEIAELKNDRAETNVEEIFSEVNERMAGANNIILYDAEESKAPLSTV